MATEPAADTEQSEWGATTEMNAMEAMMWRGEADPRMRQNITSVDVLDELPDWERLRNAHDWATRLVPRFRQRVAEPLLGLGTPVWAVDPDFQLDRHLRRMRLPAPGSFRQLLDVAAEIASAPFDREHPPWEAVLLEGLEGGRAGYVLKMHHSHTDGLGSMQLLTMLHSRQREPTRDKTQKPPPPPQSPGGTEVLAGQLLRTARGAPGALLRTVGDGLGLVGEAVLHPDRAVGEAIHYARSFERVLSPPPAKPSPLLAGRSLKWRFEALEVPLKDLKAAGKAGGGSVNDAFIAAVLGGYRRYHEAFDVHVDEIPVALPVSIRKDDDPMGGNQFAGLRMAAPMGEPDPRARMRKLRELIVNGREEPALDALGVLAMGLGRLPGPLIARLAAPMTVGNDLQASNVPGIAHPVYMAGARITHMYPFGPLPGCAAMVTLISHSGTCCIGANLDAAAFTDPDLFATCLGEGFAEVLDLRGD